MLTRLSHPMRQSSAQEYLTPHRLLNYARDSPSRRGELSHVFAWLEAFFRVNSEVTTNRRIGDSLARRSSIFTRKIVGRRHVDSHPWRVL